MIPSKDASHPRDAVRVKRACYWVVGMQDSVRYNTDEIVVRHTLTGFQNSYNFYVQIVLVPWYF